MVDYWKSTKNFFFVSLIFLGITLFLASYFGAGSFDMAVAIMWFSPIILSLLFYLLTICAGIKALKSGKKKAWFLIIISTILSLIYVLYLILTILDTYIGMQKFR